MPPITLQAKPWRPDMPQAKSGVSSYVSNVVSRTEQTYGPVSDLQDYATSPLVARCQGAISVLDADGNVNTFAGTDKNLYQMTVAGPTFSEVSKSHDAYSCDNDEMWSYTLFGDNVIASDFADPIQVFDLSGGSVFADLSADAPKARYVATAKGFLFAANTFDAIDGAVPWRTWWSAYGDASSWPTPGTSAAAAAQSDFNDTVGEGGWIQGIVGNLGTADLAIFFEHAVWRVVYTGPPSVFTFSPAEGVRGTPAPSSIVQLGAFVYYLGEDGFYVFDGTTSLPIGAEKVDRTFYADLDKAYMFRVVGAVDPVNKLVLWAYPGAGNSQGNPNRIIVYNWETKEWGIVYIEVETIFRALSFGYSLDGLDVVSASLDALMFSLDSRVWTGGNLVLAGFNTSHTMGYFQGANLAATMDTEEIQPFNGQRTFVRNARPLVDGVVTPSVALGLRRTTESTPTYGSPSAMNSLGWCPLRGNDQYIRARITIPAASVFQHIQGVELDVDPAGAR